MSEGRGSIRLEGGTVFVHGSITAVCVLEHDAEPGSQKYIIEPDSRLSLDLDVGNGIDKIILCTLTETKTNSNVYRSKISSPDTKCILFKSDNLPKGGGVHFDVGRQFYPAENAEGSVDKVKIELARILKQHLSIRALAVIIVPKASVIDGDESAVLSNLKFWEGAENKTGTRNLRADDNFQTRGRRRLQSEIDCPYENCGNPFRTTITDEVAGFLNVTYYQFAYQNCAADMGPEIPFIGAQHFKPLIGLSYGDVWGCEPDGGYNRYLGTEFVTPDNLSGTNYGAFANGNYGYLEEPFGPNNGNGCGSFISTYCVGKVYRGMIAFYREGRWEFTLSTRGGAKVYMTSDCSYPGDYESFIGNHFMSAAGYTAETKRKENFKQGECRYVEVHWVQAYSDGIPSWALDLQINFLDGATDGYPGYQWFQKSPSILARYWKCTGVGSSCRARCGSAAEFKSKEFVHAIATKLEGDSGDRCVQNGSLGNSGECMFVQAHYEGWLQLKKDGPYTLRLQADDEAQLCISPTPIESHMYDGGDLPEGAHCVDVLRTTLDVDYDLSQDYYIGSTFFVGLRYWQDSKYREPRYTW